MGKIKASLIIPVYNEGDAIAGILDTLLAYPFIGDYEIIIVSDGSTDGTSDILRKYHERRGGFTLLEHERNKGYGASLKTGLEAASSETIIITDADGSYPNERIPELVDRYNDNGLDMLVGARVGADAKIPWIRRPPKWVLNKIANVLVGYAIPDINSGLRVFNRQVAMDNFNLLCDGFSFTTTITLIMLTQRYKVEYVPISYHKRLGHSKIHPIKDPLAFLMIIVTTILYFRPMKVLLPVATLLLLAGGVLAVYQALFLQNITTVTLLLTATGFNVLILSLIADLIVKSRDR